MKEKNLSFFLVLIALVVFVGGFLYWGDSIQRKAQSSAHQNKEKLTEEKTIRELGLSILPISRTPISSCEGFSLEQEREECLAIVAVVLQEYPGTIFDINVGGTEANFIWVITVTMPDTEKLEVLVDGKGNLLRTISL